jgi:hypothetical protein
MSDTQRIQRSLTKNGTGLLIMELSIARIPEIRCQMSVKNINGFLSKIAPVC